MAHTVFHDDAPTRAQAALLTLLHTLGAREQRHRLLRSGDSFVYAIEPSNIVVRLSRERRALHRARTELAVAAYLQSERFPAVRPVDWLSSNPIQLHGWIVTIWHYERPSGEKPSAYFMGGLLRAFHDVMRNFQGAVPRLDPMSTTRACLRALLRHKRPDQNDLEWLQERCDQIAQHANHFASYLGERCLHGDFHSGNVINTTRGPILSDFETVSIGPVEWDLVPILVAVRRFGLPDAEASHLFQGYGADPRLHTDVTPLLDARELAMVAWLLQNRFRSTADFQEASNRLRSLRDRNTSAPWVPM